MSSMIHREISPRSILWIVLGQILASITAFLLYEHFQAVREVRGFCGPIGLFAALFGSGIALWFSLRVRTAAHLGAAALSLFPLALWAWLIYEKVHVP